MRSSMPAWVAAVALGLTAGCQMDRRAERGAADPTLALSQAEWREAETEHVIVWTDLSESAAKQMAHELEWFRRAMLLVWGPDVNPPDKMRVIVARSQQELAAFGAERYRGAYSTTPLGPHLFLAAEGGYLLGDSAATESLTKHELAHAVMHKVLRHQPRWVAEGLANYLETIHVQADGNVIIGRADVQSLSTVRGSGRIPLSTLLAWEDDTGLRESDLGAHYSTAWAWVHFLFNSYPDAFVAYLQALQAGSADEAWAKTLGQLPADRLERELSVHLSQGRGVLVTVPFPGIKDTVELRPLSPSNIQVAVSLLHLAVPGRPKETRLDGAQAAAARAVELDEKNASAQRLLSALTGAPAAMSSSGPGEGSTAVVSTRECPADIVREDPLELELSLRAGAWVPEILPAVFAASATAVSPPPSRRVDATLASGKVSLVSAAWVHGGAVAVVRDVGDGGCVVNTWATRLPDTELRDVTHWVSKDRKVAVYLLHLREAPKGKPASSRWVALATDGKSLWPALGGAGGLHFLAKSAKLRPQSGKLYLDVIVKGPGGIVFALRDNGRFEQLGAQR